MHQEPVATVVLGLAIILVAAKIGGALASRMGQPAVLGELIAGMVLGNVVIGPFQTLAHAAALDMLAEIGVLILLFEVGLESSLRRMLEVGPSSLLVAVLGVVAPFALGWATSAWLLPQGSAYLHAFLGATLCATSVGISARVFEDLGRADTAEARVILGAAVIDDVLGLVVLAAVTGAIVAAGAGGSFSAATVLAPLGKAVLFLVVTLSLGGPLARRIFKRITAPATVLAAGLAWCFALSWLSSVLGLAPIVGAFAAGLVLEPGHDDRSLEPMVRPIGAFLVPVFFVMMGMRTDLRAFAQPGVLGLATALTLAAILGKQACSLGVLGNAADRLTVGVGMIPRGEVGLIFANIGTSLTFAGAPVVDASVFSAIVVMVVVTTLVTPPALQWRLRHLRR